MTTLLVTAAFGLLARPDAAASVAHLATLTTVQQQDQDDDAPQRRDAQRSDRERPDRPQRERRERQGGFGRFTPPAHPLMTTLDTDEDGVISAEEIEKAAAALKSLDKNEDGKLSDDEMNPFAGRGFRQGRGFGFRGLEGRDEPDDRAGDAERGRRGRAGFGRGPFDRGQFNRGRFGGQGGFGPARDRGQEGPRGAFGFGGGNSAQSILSRDQNDDGKVTKDEWLAPMERLFDRADANGDGAIDKNEAGRMAQRMRPSGPGADDRRGPGFGGGPGRGNFAARLMQRDANGDGKLTQDELPENMQRIFGRLDANDDGAIDKAEAERAAESFRQPPGDRRRPRDARPRRRPATESDPQRRETDDAQSDDDQASAPERRPANRGRDFLARAGLELGQPLPGVSAYDAEGNPFDLARLKGHYSVIAFGCLT